MKSDIARPDPIIVPIIVSEKYVEESDYIQSEILEAEGVVMLYMYNAVETVDRGYLTRVEKLVKDLEDRIKLCRIDTYKSNKLACKFGWRRTGARRRPARIIYHSITILLKTVSSHTVENTCENACKYY